MAITNDNSKYSGFMGPKKAGPPPGRKMGGTIDVIGGGGLASRRNLDKGTPPKENVIQVNRWLSSECNGISLINFFMKKITVI